MTFTTTQLLAYLWKSTETWLIKAKWLKNLRSFRGHDLSDDEWMLLENLAAEKIKEEFRKTYYNIGE